MKTRCQRCNAMVRHSPRQRSKEMSNEEDLPKYDVRISTRLNVTVTVHAEDESDAADKAWELAEEYARTLAGDSYVTAEASFDGIGADSVEEVGDES